VKQILDGKCTIARITKNNERFEVLVNPQKALNYRLGKIKIIKNILIMDTIFSDANKGTKVSDEKLNKAFNTKDVHKIVEVILKKGELQLTTEQRRKMVEDKKKQIIDFISRQCIDPKTNVPHPSLRIESALKKIHYSINPFKSTEEQGKEVIRLLRPILPLKMEQISFNVRIPTRYAARTYGRIKGMVRIKQEEWLADGSWYGLVELPAGLRVSFIEKIGDLTKGQGEVKRIL
jgi:ribosome maturation protein SDO1